MKYLQPKFSMAVTDRRPNWKLTSTRPRQEPKPGHRFAPANGICLVCMLDKIGHERKYSCIL